MASNDPFVIDAEVNIQRYGSIEKVKAKLTKEASDLFEKLPEYVFGQQDRKHELFVVCRPEDNHGRNQFMGKVCALVESTNIPNHARIHIPKAARRPKNIKEMLQRRSEIGRIIYNREVEMEALKAEDRELEQQINRDAADVNFLENTDSDVLLPKGAANYVTFRTEYWADGWRALKAIQDHKFNLVQVRRLFDFHDWLMCITIELPSSTRGDTLQEQVEEFRQEWEDILNKYHPDLHRCWQTLDLGFEPKDPFD